MLVYATYTDKGSRSINEDSIGYIADENKGFFVLADGLGGHGRGEIASQLAVEKAIEQYHLNPGDLDNCFIQSQNRLVDEQKKLNVSNELKTTMVCLYINEGNAVWGHIGDSRVYHFKAGKLSKRTLDHSVTQMLVQIGDIREKDIRGHVDRNRLLRVLGMEWNEPKYELAEKEDLCGDDAFLLCSDGFWEWIKESDMEKTLKKAKTPAQWIEMMKIIVKKNSKDKDKDNLSAITIKIKC